MRSNILLSVIDVSIHFTLLLHLQAGKKTEKAKKALFKSTHSTSNTIERQLSNDTCLGDGCIKNFCAFRHIIFSPKTPTPQEDHQAFLLTQGAPFSFSRRRFQSTLSRKLYKMTSHGNKSAVKPSSSSKAKILFLLSLLPSETVLGFTSPPLIISTKQATATPVKSLAITPSQLRAIIYGWDGEEDEGSSSGQPSYFDSGPSMYDDESCSTDGMTIAETLMMPNGQHVSSLAKLAVVFSPPERCITLKDIEHVNVKCVRHDRIELEAMLCETHGCVNLSIPITFPNQCDDSLYTSTLEGCVMSNIDQLSLQAESTLKLLAAQEGGTTVRSQLDLEDLCLLNEAIEQFPSWWIAPELNHVLSSECTNIKSLLNDEEFESSIVALAQDGLDHTPGNPFLAQKAKVAVVGPAGICLKVGAIRNTQSITTELSFLDVTYPFGLNEPVRDVESLRAVVLGAIAAAEDKYAQRTY